MKKGVLLAVICLLGACSENTEESTVGIEPIGEQLQENEVITDIERGIVFQLNYENEMYSPKKVILEAAALPTSNATLEDVLQNDKYIKKVYGKLNTVENHQQLKEVLQAGLSGYDAKMGVIILDEQDPEVIVAGLYNELANTDDMIGATLYGYTYMAEKIDGGYFVDLDHRFFTNNIELATINNKIDEIINKLDFTEKSDLEKIRILYDYVMDNMEYVDQGKRYAHSPLGFLLYGEGVCQAYAVSLHMLFERVGLESRFIVGRILDVEPELSGHAWNMVKLEGSWYHLDATWDDDADHPDGYYFLKSDDYMKMSREWAQKYYEKAPESYIY